MALVYQATNLINGKRYIGVTKRTLRIRIGQHRRAAITSRTRMLFHRAIRKYGPDMFRWKIMADRDVYADALAVEIRLIAALKPEYNLTAGGQGSIGIKQSQETVEKRRATLKRIGHRPILTPEIRKKISDSRRGQPGYWLGKKRDPEMVERMRISLTGRKIEMTPARVVAQEKNLRAMHQKNRKAVICVTDGARYVSVIEACHHYGISTASVIDCCKGHAQQRCGLQFKYAEAG